jgi:HEPN domain-containing protein
MLWIQLDSKKLITIYYFKRSNEMSSKKYVQWLKQAQNDLLWAKHSLQGEYFSQVCFISQQIGEKAIKGMAYFQGADLVKSHSIVLIAKELKLNGEIEKAGRILDMYYMSSRYPDALPDQISPADYFSKDQAEEAIQNAEIILNKIEKLIG